jgi:hypothetical protein
MDLDKIITETINKYVNGIINEKITIDRITKGKHSQNGFIVISANRGDKSPEENEMNRKRLKNEIIKSGFGFNESFGGYRNLETNEDAEYEPSFIVYNYNQQGEPTDFNTLVEYGKRWCGEYEQDCFLVKAPKQAPIYMDSEGNKVNSTESNQVWKNDPSKEYFTTLNTPQKDAANKKFGKIGRRWTNDISF